MDLGKRKLLKINYSQLIILPKFWLKAHKLNNLKKEVRLILTDDNDLLIKNG